MLDSFKLSKIKKVRSNEYIKKRVKIMLTLKKDNNDSEAKRNYVSYFEIRIYYLKDIICLIKCLLMRAILRKQEL